MYMITFICLHLKLMGMKTRVNLYQYANSEALRELDKKKIIAKIDSCDFLVENRKRINKQYMTQ